MNIFPKRNPYLLTTVITAIAAFVLLWVLSAPKLFVNKDVRASRIAIVDGSRIKTESKPFRYLAQCEKDELDNIYNLMQGRHKKVRELLAKSKDLKVPLKERVASKKESERLALVYENEVQRRKEFLRTQFAALSRTLEDTVIAATRDLARKYGLYVIFNTNVCDTLTVFYAKPNIDLTEEVIRMVDKRLAHIHYPSFDEKNPPAQSEAIEKSRSTR